MKAKKITAFVIMLILTAAILPATAFAAKPGITEVRITGIVPPVGGETADLSYSIPENAGYTVDVNQWIRESDNYAIVDDMTFTAGEAYFRNFSLKSHGWFSQDVKVYIDGQDVSGNVSREEGGHVICVRRSGYIASTKLSAVNAVIKNFTVGNKFSQVEAESADPFRYSVIDFRAEERRSGKACTPNTVLKNTEYLVFATFIPQPGYTITQDTEKQFNGTAGYTPSELDGYIYLTPEPQSIKEVKLTVKAPAAGEKPGKAATTDKGYTVAQTSWEPPCDKFAYGTAYSVVITIEAQSGFRFAKSTSYQINGQNAKLISSGADQVKLTMEFPAAEEPVSENEITEAAITDIVLPVVGAHPDFGYKTADNAPYTVESFTWIYDTVYDLNEGNVFEESGNYIAEFCLKPKEGYHFAENVQVTLNGTPVEQDDLSGVKLVNAGTADEYLLVDQRYAAQPEETPAPTASAEPSEQPAVSANPTEEPKDNVGSNKTFPVFAIVISVIGITALAAAIVVMIILLVRKKKK